MGTEGTFGLEIYSSSEIFYHGRASFIDLPATDGGHTFLAHHENVVIALVPGITRFVPAGNEAENGAPGEGTAGQTDGAAVSGAGSAERIIATGAGFAEMINNRVKVFVHSAERPEDIDVNRAREAKERAEEQLRQENSQREYYRNQRELARAMSRLSAAGKKK